MYAERTISVQRIGRERREPLSRMRHKTVDSCQIFKAKVWQVIFHLRLHFAQISDHLTNMICGTISNIHQAKLKALVTLGCLESVRLKHPYGYHKHFLYIRDYGS